MCWRKGSRGPALLFVLRFFFRWRWGATAHSIPPLDPPLGSILYSGLFDHVSQVSINLYRTQLLLLVMAYANFLVVGLQNGPVNMVNERYTTSMLSLMKKLLMKVCYYYQIQGLGALSHNNRCAMFCTSSSRCAVYIYPCLARFCIKFVLSL